MRGDVERTEDLFSYVALADRVPSDHPLRSIRAFVDPILRELSPPLRRDLCQDRPTLDPAGAVAEGASAAGSVYGQERADAV